MTTGQQDDSPTMFFHQQLPHQHDHWLTLQVTNKNIKNSQTYAETHRQLLFLENEWKKIVVKHNVSLSLLSKQKQRDENYVMSI